MSAVEYTRCDGDNCGRVTPDEPESYMHEDGWARVTVWGGDCYDLCPDCARRALAAVGIDEMEATRHDR